MRPSSAARRMKSWPRKQLCSAWQGLGFRVLGLHRDNGKENGNYRDSRGCIGVIWGLYWGYLRIMDKRIETTRMGHVGVLGYILSKGYNFMMPSMIIMLNCSMLSDAEQRTFHNNLHGSRAYEIHALPGGIFPPLQQIQEQGQPCVQHAGIMIGPTMRSIVGGTTLHMSHCLNS